MIILCLYIPHLPVQWELRRHPELVQAALVIGGLPYERKAVLDCSEKATTQGISPGMTLRQASHHCPDAIFLPIDEAGYVRASEEVLDILDQFSPMVEADSPGRAFLDVSGTEHLFGPAENLAGQVSNEVLHKTGLQSQIGVASSKFLAGMAASLASTSPLTILAAKVIELQKTTKRLEAQTVQSDRTAVQLRSLQERWDMAEQVAKATRCPRCGNTVAWDRLPVDVYSETAFGLFNRRGKRCPICRYFEEAKSE